MQGVFIVFYDFKSKQAEAYSTCAGDFMPTYSNATPPNSLFPGDVGFSFNAEAFPADGAAGAQFAIPEPAGLPDQGHTVRWQTIFGSNPSAINIRLQGATADVDAEYADLDTSTTTTGEARTVTAVRARFLRIKKVTSTGGTGLTAKMLP
jgi:hypothetical protein